MHAFRLSGEELTRSLEDIPLFAGLSKESASGIVRMSSVFVYDEGETVIQEGSDPASFFILISGELLVEKAGHSGEAVPVGSLSPGAFFGEESLFFDSPANASVRTGKTSTVLVLPKKDFLAYINREPKDGLVIMTCIVLDLVKKLNRSNENALEKERRENSDDLEHLHNLLPFTMSDILPGASSSESSYDIF